MRFLIFILTFSSVFASNWAEQTLKEMSLEQKVGQLFVIPLAAIGSDDHLVEVKHLVQQGVGSILVQKTDMSSLKHGLNYLQGQVEVPLLVLMDAEWGAGMRVSDAPSFPKNLCLGALDNSFLLEEVGYQVGLWCEYLGGHICLGPVVDVNSCPQNPIIGIRSFGDQPNEVARRARSWIQGLHRTNIRACLKHFPGHGDTHVDSHKGLPILNHDLQRLRSVEFVPFIQLLDEGVSVMSAHLLCPSIDPEYPATLSSKAIGSILQNQWGFNGLMISDALNMKALTAIYGPNEIAKLAFLAGNHQLLYGTHVSDRIDKLIRTTVPEAIAFLCAAFRNKELDEQELDRRVLRVLENKYKLCFSSKEPKMPSVEKANQLRSEIYRAAITSVSHNENNFPIQLVGKIAYVSSKQDLLSKGLGANYFADCFSYEEMPEDFHEYSTVIFGVYRNDEKKLELLPPKAQNQILIFFTSPYRVPKAIEGDCILVAYEDVQETQEAIWEILQGELAPKGILPVQLSHE